MHEMISARHPFHGPSHYDTLRNMVTKPPTMDPRLSPGAAAVVKRFLIKNPRTRLCCKDGTSEMKALPYFGIVNWDALYHRRIAMPYKPNLVSDTDVSSFENTFTQEHPIDLNPGPKVEDAGKKKAGTGGLLGLFGYGKDAQAANAKTEVDDDAFKGFSFVKDEAAVGEGVAGAEAGDLPVPPAARTK
jgi:hypothetical protein